MEQERTRDQTAEIHPGALAKERFARRAQISLNMILSHEASPDRCEDERKIIIELLFRMEGKAAYRRVTVLRKQLKGRFSGQEVNKLERIFAILHRAEREGSVIPMDKLRSLARRAASDNACMQEFLFFVPEKIPYRDRKAGA